MDRNAIESEILAALEQVNRELPESRRVKVDRSARLFGGDGTLDSLALVTLVMMVEQRIEERTGVGLTIADERAMSQKSSPFRSVESLADYVAALLKEANG